MVTGVVSGLGREIQSQLGVVIGGGIQVRYKSSFIEFRDSIRGDAVGLIEISISRCVCLCASLTHVAEFGVGNSTFEFAIAVELERREFCHCRSVVSVTHR